MDKKQASLDLIRQQGLLPLYYHNDAEVSVAVLKALYEAGIRAVEYTNRGAAALANFKEMLRVRDAEMPGLQLGIGTIKNTQDAQAFLDAGADYIISPGFVPSVAELVHKAGYLYVPGCMTPTEIIAAEQAGCTFVKIFPGNLFGPSFVSAIYDLFPEVYFMPTGGVELEEANINGWFKAGVMAVGMGSKLISKTLLEQKDYTTIKTLTQQAIELVNKVRSK